MTDAELTVLSLVAEGPQHDHQIQQAIEDRGVREWAAIGFSSVFYLLNKLENDGLLASQLTPSARGPARKVYELTKAGRQVLQTAVADLLSTPHDRGSGFVLGLANMHLLRPDQVRHALDSYESQLRTRVAEVNHGRADLTEKSADPSLAMTAIYDYSLRMLLAELEWLTEFRQAWEAQAPPTPPKRSPLADPIVRDHPTPHSAPTERLPRPEPPTDPKDDQAH
jgi:DNA-binding PadR family transcriptional regulator